MSENSYDCAVIGGGLAGLSLAIQLAESNKKVILFEKEEYPFHKVCGEYISNESINFIEKLGVNFSNYNLPSITKLFMTSPYGISVECPLDIGGLGISRYKLDEILYKIALAKNVDIRTNSKVKNVNFENDLFTVVFEQQSVTAKVVAGGYGKNSNIDVQLKRNFVAKDDSHLFIAVKHHIEYRYDKNRVELHNFPGGYCGMSAIEDNKVNLSYITRIKNLKSSKNIHDMEKNILSVNPFLREYFSKANFIFEKPLVISHLCFGIKSPIDSHILMLGDAAGNIAPLSGNGMSIALKSSLLAYNSINLFLENKLNREQMENDYLLNWKDEFSSRIKIAKMINYNFGKRVLTDFNVLIFKLFPLIVTKMSKNIHGKPF